jgi:hypothetical protein
MACTEITDAIAWNNKTTANEHYQVDAYFTKHFGTTGVLDIPQNRDTVHFASGRVSAANKPTPHLKGTLKVWKNDENGKMVSSSQLTYDVEIYPDGTLSYLQKINGSPIGGAAPTKVQATCVNNVLLTATFKSEVVTVGVARLPVVLIT